MNQRSRLVIAFLLTLGTLVGGAGVAGFITADGAETPPAVENEQYQDASVISDSDPGTATVRMNSTGPAQTIVVDPGIEPTDRLPVSPLALLGFGGPETTDRDIRPLANVLIRNGHEIRVWTPPDRRSTPPGADSEPDQSALGEELADADAFLTFRTDYSQSELEDIETFRDNDGRIVYATDPAETFEEPGPAALDSILGVTTEPGYVYNMGENDLNYQRIYAESANGSGLTDSVDRAVFPTATPMETAGGGSAQLRPIDGSELSTTRAETTTPVAVRNGGVVAVGDSDFLSPENAQRADNDALIGNLAEFLVENDRTPSQQPPTAEESQRDRPERSPAPPRERQTPPANGSAAE